MTESELRAKLVNQAKSYLGCVSGDSKYTHILSVYNAHKPLAEGYTVKPGDSWCATFASAMFIECGMDGLIVTECGCQRMINKNATKGIWVENDAYVPKPGDLIFFDWEDTGAGDNNGWADHVGIIESVSGNTMTSIEGNYCNGVNRRTLSVNNRYIRGYITPKFSSIATAPAPAQAKSGITKDAKYVGRVNTDFLNVRIGPGAEHALYTPYSTLCRGNLVDVCYEENGWLYICIAKAYGTKHAQNCHYAWVSGKYIDKA